MNVSSKAACIQYMKNRFESAGFNPDTIKLEQLYDYYEMLIETNKVINLTAITEFEEVVDKHLIDSVMPGRLTEFREQTIADLGTGAGFPGIPLKIFYPDLRMTLADSLNKRILFLDRVISTLGLHNIETVHTRAEEMGRSAIYREHFDLCVSRAVANLSTLAEYCLPLVKNGGFFISYKSADVKEELSGAVRAIRILGGKTDRTEYFELPGTDIRRSLVFIRKIGNTPKQYPRKAGTPAKEPLT